MTVVDVSQFLSGPFCTMMLADLGAKVIKIESAAAPDPMGLLGAAREASTPLAFHLVNRDKRSITADLKQADDLARVREPVDRADALVENFRPGVGERLGSGAHDVWASNPRLIYASLSGFGSSEPAAAPGGYDLLAQAMSGIMRVTGDPERDPLKAGVPVTKAAGRPYLAIGILATLAAPERDGESQQVATSLPGARLSFGAWEAAEFWARGTAPRRMGNVHRSVAPYQIVRAAKGTRCVIAANTDRMFNGAAAVFGRQAWTTDGRFKTTAARQANRIALIQAIEHRPQRPRPRYGSRRLQDAVCPHAGPGPRRGTRTRAGIRHRNGVEVDDDTGGTIPLLGSPVTLSGTPVRPRHGAPVLGDSNGGRHGRDHEPRITTAGRE